MGIARVIGVIGRALVVAGLLLLYYTAYLLVGTNAYTRSAQKELAHRLQRQAAAPATAAEPIPATLRPPVEPKKGDPLFTLVIPKIGLRAVVVEGVEAPELKKGPGHFPGKPFPGEPGNVPISGHRTTFGAPFFRLNELEPGDPIYIESGRARFSYTVTEQLVVAPTQVEVVENRGLNELTLTTCHPRFSAAQRLIVHARYEGNGPIPVAAPAGRARAARGEEVLVPAPPPAVPTETLVLSLVSVASLLGAMGLSKRLRPVAAWVAVVLSTGAGLWTGVFPQVLRLLPANY